MPKITDSELLLVSKAKAEKLKNYAEGISLQTRSGSSIDQLKLRVSKDRLRLAKDHLNDAAHAYSATPRRPRASISRSYYAMYHAARAVTYLSFGGDDHEEHSVLPTRFPSDFPDSDNWKNKLKNARLERNKADYDPYPKRNADFEESCETLMQDAKSFFRIAQKYINNKA